MWAGDPNINSISFQHFHKCNITWVKWTALPGKLRKVFRCNSTWSRSPDIIEEVFFLCIPTFYPEIFFSFWGIFWRTFPLLWQCFIIWRSNIWSFWSFCQLSMLFWFNISNFQIFQKRLFSNPLLHWIIVNFQWSLRRFCNHMEFQCYCSFQNNSRFWFPVITQSVGFQRVLWLSKQQTL